MKSTMTLTVVLYTTLLLQCTVVLCDEYRIAWLVPASSTTDSQASTSVGGLSLALTHITQQGLMPGDTFNVTYKSTSCDRKEGIISIYNVLVTDNFNPDIVVGPPCTEAMYNVGELAGYRNLPIFTWQSENAVFGDKVIYNSLVRSYGPVNEIAENLLDFLSFMTWTTVELVSTTSYKDIGQGVYDTITASSSITLVRWQDSMADTETTANIRNYYDNTFKKEARILIMAVPLSSLRTWMLAAYDSGMVDGDFVFIYLYNEVPTEAFKTSVLTTVLYSTADGRDKQADKAYENLLMLTQNLAFVDSFNTFSSEAAGVTSSADLAAIGITTITAGNSDVASVFLHDAVYLWGHLVNESRTQGLTKSDINGTYLLSLAENRIFSGSSWASGTVYMDNHADRSPDFWILDMGHDNIFRVAMETEQTLSAGSITSKFVITEDIIWGDGKTGFANRPPSTPECGFENENCTDLVPYIVPPVIILVLIIVIIVVIIVYRKYTFEQSLKEMVWKINKDELKLKADNTYMGSAFIRMSKASSIQQSHSSRIFKRPSSQHTGTNSNADSTSNQETQQVFIQLASYRKNTVAVKVINKQKLKLDRELLIEMRQMTDMKHTNLASFIGATTETPQLYVVWEYCTKGSLSDVLFNDSITLDSMFKFSLASDILKGLKYLHKSSIKVHGSLKSGNCLIDSRWVCKLTDFGLVHFQSNQQVELSEYRQYYKLLWTSPEDLRLMPKDVIAPPRATQTGDVYAAAIIIKEIFARNGPYTEYEDDFSPKDIVSKVAAINLMKPFRPDLTEVKNSKAPSDLIDVIKEGWSENPDDRPTVAQMLSKINRINPNKSTNVMDNVIKMLESYSNNLEGLVQERLRQVEDEKKRSEALLYRMLPKSVAEDLKKGLHVAPEAYDAVSIYFSDIVSFTKLAAQSTPMQVVHMLNVLYTEFDSITQNHDVYKVETIGDAYMYVSGLPVRNDDRHAVEVVNCSMDLLSCVQRFTVPHLEDYVLRIRIGIHTGPVVAGVVGVTMPRFCLFGDTVTVASLMESGGQPMRIHFSEKTFVYLSRFTGFMLAERGFMDVKGKRMKTYFIVSKEGYQLPFPDFDELAKDDDPPCKKLPVTKGKVVREGPIRPSADESGFYGSEDNNSNILTFGGKNAKENSSDELKMAETGKQDNDENYSLPNTPEIVNTTPSPTDGSTKQSKVAWQGGDNMVSDDDSSDDMDSNHNMEKHSNKQSESVNHRSVQKSTLPDISVDDLENHQ